MLLLTHKSVNDIIFDGSLSDDNIWIIGRLFEELHSVGARFRWSVGDLLDIILDAVANDSFILVYEEFGRFVGHIIWSKVTEQGLTILLEEGPSALPKVPIVSGDRIWVWDMQARFGKHLQLIRHGFSEIPHSPFGVAYFRRKQGEIIIKLTKSNRKINSRLPAKSAFSLYLDNFGLRSRIRAEMENMTEFALELMFLKKSTSLPGFMLVNGLSFLTNPKKIDQQCFIKNIDGDIVGYVSWAWRTSSDVGLGPVSWRLDEWNEGRELCIVDRVVLEGNETLLLDFLRCTLFPELPLTILGPDKSQVVFNRKDLSSNLDLGLKSIDLSSKGTRV